MGVRCASVWSNTQANAMPSGNTEAVILVTPQIILAADSAVVSLGWQFTLVVGTACTSVTFNIRRGSTLSGTAVGYGAWTQTVTATKTVTIAGSYSDMAGVTALPYCLTIQQNTGSSASAFVDACLLAFVL